MDEQRPFLSQGMGEEVEEENTADTGIKWTTVGKGVAFAAVVIIMIVFIALYAQAKAAPPVVTVINTVSGTATCTAVDTGACSGYAGATTTTTATASNTTSSTASATTSASGTSSSTVAASGAPSSTASGAASSTATASSSNTSSATAASTVNTASFPAQNQAIKSVADRNQCIDNPESLATSQYPLQTYKCNGTAAQQWTYNGTLVNTGNNLCLDIQNGGTSDGTLVGTATCDASKSSQQWIYANQTLTSPAAPGKCLSAGGPPSAARSGLPPHMAPSPMVVNGTKLQMLACNSYASQKWTL
jgi:hypothetical protein